MGFEAQREQFATQGYAVFERVLVGELLDLLREQCAAFVAREDARMDAKGVDSLGLSHRGKRYFANECQREAPALRKMLFSETMADVCRATLGDDAYFFFDQYVVKGPEGGLPFGWHQDSGYVVGNGGPVDHAPYLTCWCPLDDATLENGTVRVLPFSEAPLSRDWILPHERQPRTNDLVGWKGNEEGVVLEVPAGSVVAFSSHLLHTTGANMTDAMRRAYLAQYTPEVMLNPGTRKLRRNAIPLVQNGEQVTRG
ncbi:phytanoyl-CoA dioxygenase family protein [Phenylobacterium sp.]|uniref:phytanoyl-CoA dioxygenase family protein n=1 Tax=Phenylobacterium sp. TaxID=1871053 RepID=UPI00374D4487